MTIIDRARGSRRLRIDTRQLGDELAKRLPDLDQVDLGKARDAAGDAIADATRGLRSDLEKAGDSVTDSNAFEELSKRLRSLGDGGFSGIVSRLERELPDTDKDRYERAYERGRIQARSVYVVVGAVVGLAAGALAIALFDPARGKARRDAIAKRLSTATSGLTQKVREQSSKAQERARGIAAAADDATPDGGRVGVMDPEIGTPAWPAAEGPLDQPLESPEFGAHEALPDELVSAAHVADPGDPAETSPRA